MTMCAIPLPSSRYTERLHVELVAARLGDGSGPSPRTVNVVQVVEFVIDSIRTEKQRRKSGKDRHALPALHSNASSNNNPGSGGGSCCGARESCPLPSCECVCMGIGGR